MTGRVGRLHCRFRVQSRVGTAATAGLDRLLRERATAVLGEALDRAVADDPAVYVLRRVEAAPLAHARVPGADAVLARRWGEQLASEVVWAIAADTGDGSNLVRFTDEAEFVARFVADLLEGSAWSAWFYGAFAPLRAHGRAGAIRTVLLDHRELLPRILSCLERLGVLERLLAELDPETLRLLRLRHLDEESAPDAASLRPIVAAAFRLVDALDAWAASRPELAATLAAYAATRPRQVDWRDRAGLAEALLDALRFLAAKGLTRPLPADPERLASALADLDWLDAELVATWLVDSNGGRGADGLPPRPAGGGATPRQRRLLAHLVRALRERGLRLTAAELRSPRAALRVHAVLVAAFPEWENDPLAASLVVRVVEAAAAAVDARTEGPAPAAEAVGAGARSGREALERRVKIQVPPGLGPAAAEAVALLAGAAGPEPVWFDSDCAGAFLLLRVLNDLRVPELAARRGYPPPGPLPSAAALVAGLAARWAGDCAFQLERLDSALACLAGLDEPPSVETFATAWETTTVPDHNGFASELLELLRARRLLPSGSEAVSADVAALGDGQLGVPAADAALGVAAATLLRAWAYWLPGFGDASAGYLLEQLIRRPGRVADLGSDLTVELERRPLDILLELASYTAPLEWMQALDVGPVTFSLVERLP